MSLIRSVVSLTTLQLVAYLIPLAMLPYLARSLGSETLGVLLLVQSFSQYFVLLVDYGFNLSATRRAASLGDSAEDLGRLFWTVTAAKALLLCVAAVLYALVIWAIPLLRSHLAVCLTWFLAPIGALAFPLWFLQGVQRFDIQVKAQLVARIACAIWIFQFVSDANDDLLAAALLASPTLLAACATSIWLFRAGCVPFRKPTVSGLIDVLKEGRTIFGSSLAVGVYTLGNTFVLGLVAGPTVVANFGIADRIVRAITALISPVSQALYPRVSRLASRNVGAPQPGRGSYFGLYVIGGAVISAATVLGAPMLVNVLFGAEYRLAVVLLQIMGFMPLAISISTSLGTLTLLPFGHERSFGVALGAAAIVSLCIMWPLASRFGAEGAAASALVAEALVAIFLYIGVRKMTRARG